MKTGGGGQKPESGELAFVALGSNLGDSRQIILQAMDRLQQLSDESLLRSSVWHTKPVDCPPGSPDFLNAVVGLVPRKGTTPESLHAQLQEIEREFGRKAKVVHNEPRPLDLDLLAFGKELRDSAALTLPHARAHERRFVLQPLGEIAPEFILPGQTESVARLLEKLSPDTSIRLAGKR